MLNLGTLGELEQLERLRHETKLTYIDLVWEYRIRYGSKYGASNPEPGMYDARKGGPIHKDFKISGAYSEVKVRGFHQDVIEFYGKQLDDFEIDDEAYLELTHPSHEYLAGR